MMQIYDLSVELMNDATEPNPPKIVHCNHEDGLSRLGKIAGINPEDFPEDTALATDVITAGAHNGTHVDAPFHYGKYSEGKEAKSIDKVPLDWCVGPGVVLDVQHKVPGTEITVSDIEAALEKINYSLNPGDIVLFHTGCDKYWGTDTPTYMKMQSGLGVEGLTWLLDRGIRCIGIDAWTLDRPVPAMVESFRETGDKSYLWPTHFYGRQKEYLQIEKLANLDKLPKPYGFTISALPVKIKGATGGWCRAVAIFND
ncbi:MAG TPA: cyclase family protein [Bacillota bacterium]|nr:cyclase family protein [Bacillota bacterium]